MVSAKLNLVVFEDGFKEDYPEPRALPKVGDSVETIEKVREGDALVNKKVTRKVASILTWDQRRGKMKAACINCHGDSFVDSFYAQYDSLVVLYNDKFAKPAKGIMDELIKDGVLHAEGALRA